MHMHTGRLSRAAQVCLFYIMLLWLGAMLLIGNIGLLPLLLAPRSFRAPLTQRLISGLFRVFLGGAQRCGLMRLDLGELDALNTCDQSLLVANHPSMIDVFLVVSRVHRTACLMKASIGTNVLFGVGAYLAGYVSNRRTERMLRQAARTLVPGQHLLAFPEGTRTIRQPVNDIKPGAALIAKLSRAPLRPIIIATNSPYLSQGWKLFRPPQFPLLYRASLGPRIESTGAAADTTRKLQDYFERSITRSVDPGLRV
jgi:1-acyl-sn-glycerol-3-phosphate acyltransferase